MDINWGFAQIEIASYYICEKLFWLMIDMEKIFCWCFISLKSGPEQGERSRLGQDSDQTREEVSKQSFSVVFAFTL